MFSVDLSTWQNKIKEEMHLEYDDEEDVEVQETVNVSCFLKKNH